MPELPVLRLRELLAVLDTLGFALSSQKGSHMKFKKTRASAALVVIVPKHSEIRRGTLLSIIRQKKNSLNFWAPNAEPTQSWRELG